MVQCDLNKVYVGETLKKARFDVTIESCSILKKPSLSSKSIYESMMKK